MQTKVIFDGSRSTGVDAAHTLFGLRDANIEVFRSFVTDIADSFVFSAEAHRSLILSGLSVQLVNGRCFSIEQKAADDRSAVRTLVSLEGHDVRVERFPAFLGADVFLGGLNFLFVPGTRRGAFRLYLQSVLFSNIKAISAAARWDRGSWPDPV